MPYLRYRYIQRPYAPAAYIQRGGGWFSAIADKARTAFMPWLSSLTKTASSAISQAAKSKHMKNITNQAKAAVEDGLRDAGGRILQGDNVGEVIKDSARSTKNRIASAVQKEAYKAGTSLRQNSSAVSPPKPKKVKKAPPKRKGGVIASRVSKRKKFSTLI